MPPQPEIARVKNAACPLLRKRWCGGVELESRWKQNHWFPLLIGNKIKPVPRKCQLPELKGAPPNYFRNVASISKHELGTPFNPRLDKKGKSRR